MDCQPATTYSWRVRAHQAQCNRWSAWSAPWSFTTDVVVGVPPAGLPVAFALRPNQPNPFAGSTTLRFDLPRAARVELDVFDAAGARVARLEGGVLPPGAHARSWHGMDDHGRRVGAGLYFVRMRAAEFSATRRMILIR
jgi:hypothetical protein